MSVVLREGITNLGYPLLRFEFCVVDDAMSKTIPCRVFKAFLSHSSGNVAIIFALASVALVTAAGGAVDYARATREQHALQEMLDAAALAGVSGSHEEEEQIAVANAHFAANLANQWNVKDVSFEHSGGVLVGKAEADVQTAFLRIVNMPSIDVGAQAAATNKEFLEPACVMAMHPSRKHTLELKGTVSVSGPDCDFYGNSNNPDDVVDPHNPENYLVGKSVQAVGYGHHYIDNVSPPLETAPKVLSDPLSRSTIPAAGGCSYSGEEVAGGTETLYPGTYCDGLVIKDGSDVVLSPGTYIITQGNFEIENSTLTGDGVTIVLADDKTELLWKASTVRLRAPKSGSEASFVLIGERVSAQHVFDQSTVDLEGVVYVPNGEFDWTNTGTPTTDAKWTVWIVDGFTWDGAGTIKINFNPDDSDIPYPAALRHVIPRPGTPRLIN